MADFFSASIWQEDHWNPTKIRGLKKTEVGLLENYRALLYWTDMPAASDKRIAEIMIMA